MSGKPEMPHGYLGPHGKWEELGLSTVTHNSPDIRNHEPTMKITLKITNPTKVTANLIDAKDEKEYREYILTQTLDKLVHLDIHFPHAGFFKLQIYALPSSDESTSLPNVYNYLIQCTKGPSGQAAAFPKQFTQWKGGCYLFHPFTLKGVDAAGIKVLVPGAKAVAFCVEDKWFTLEQRARQKDEGEDALIPWSAQLSGLQAFKGKNGALTANYPGDDETKYTSLLQYPL
ncbi:kyphoscoliosis peptidase-like [Babylonia areolata]|uniref:kyphoscoliosis peptidase-like n=1 Tax=Babylonia areolata TaxID=304850 RepID=UPI003FD15850